ncbi:hypothetical protein ACG9Y7_04015 [Acinetobacter gerneri]|uniref:hypothetical protein n=1 Tax=Acinetobacter gerneri TaxID=202952 RepID=UPI003AF4B15B
MTEFISRPQEIYLLERFSSAEYFKKLVDAFQNMLNTAEEALDIFMQDLPFFYRRRHISEQPDIVWGEYVLPNFRTTNQTLKMAYQQLLDGDLTALQYSANVNVCFRGQTADYLADWMDEEHYKLFNDWQNEASLYASNIKATSFGQWNFLELTDDYDEKYFGKLHLPISLPIYHINQNIKVKSGEKVPQDGVYISEVFESSAQLLLKNYDAIQVAVGLDELGQQYKYKEDTVWTLVERIADEGESSEAKKTRLKGYSGDICPESGNWWSPANQSQYHHFEKGEIFPKIENNEWGETVWYMEVNKQNA